ncbi:GATA zinc finger protein [Plectosphaerella cucumerina]|uniref:GATA zinc finger protein n=1 Tax=Plectosphaerella cucumerina TaxID=40658 RepID=A0A8K0TC77_9PEZI|nr:GATA zinc finger protein [Plectosphaerella cucumerina]
MATATLISPANPYHGHHSSYSSSHHHQPSALGPSIAGMISPVEPRRPSDDNDMPQQRQSLPSLSEVISGAKPSPFPPSQPPSSVSGSVHSFPSTYGSGPPRSFPEPPSSDKQSPRTLHPTSFGPPRPEPLPPFSEQSRPPSYGGRPGPISAYPGPQPSPPIKPDHAREMESKMMEHSGPYHHASHQHPPYSHHHSQLPPGQIPLPAYPASPRHGHSLPPPPPFESQRPSHHDDPEYAPARPQYDRTLNRALEVWSYTECLDRISASSRTIFNFGESWSRVAAEQHSSQPIPDRLPTEHEVSEMASNVEYLRGSLDSLRAIIRTAHERARTSGKSKMYDDDESSMYDGMKSNGGYNLGEVKKRRGRAAPPGRCHSCNRIDTPEWRRGPDGARTLCNACGLHYAKLERKRQLEARQVRPKTPQRS